MLCFYHGTTASAYIEMFGSGTKNSDFAVEAESVEPEKNPKYIKPSAFPWSVWEWELAKKSTFCQIQRVIGCKNVDS
jgi:hypothetical protein